MIPSSVLRTSDPSATFTGESELVGQIGQSVEGHIPSRATIDVCRERHKSAPRGTNSGATDTRS